MSAYPFRVCFTKQFTSGTLRGLTHAAQIPAPSWDDATRTRDTLQADARAGRCITPCTGRDSYRVTDVRIESAN